MKSKEHKDLEQDKDLEQLADILCDVCMESTKLNHAVLSTNWGKESKHDGEQYQHWNDLVGNKDITMMDCAYG